MDYKDFILGIMIIITPLIIFVLCYRQYVYEYCNNNNKCIEKKLFFNLPKKEKEIEGFFGGFGNWFSGSHPSNLPTSLGTLPPENINLLEQKITDKMKISKNFPPNMNDDGEFKDSDNSAILNMSKPYHGLNDLSIKLDEDIKKNTNNVVKMEKIEKMEKFDTKENPKMDSSISSLKCNFYGNKCPTNHIELGQFSIEGVTSGMALKCGNIQDVIPATGVAEIKNNSVYQIVITNSGKGYSSPPKIKIHGGKGVGATAEAIIDDNGMVKVIKITNPGNDYTDTPNIIIDPPYMNASCHLCCSNK
jgi:hypothetical protein